MNKNYKFVFLVLKVNDRCRLDDHPLGSRLAEGLFWYWGWLLHNVWRMLRLGWKTSIGYSHLLGTSASLQYNFLYHKGVHKSFRIKLKAMADPEVEDVAFLTAINHYSMFCNFFFYAYFFITCTNLQVLI